MKLEIFEEKNSKYLFIKEAWIYSWKKHIYGKKQYKWLECPSCNIKAGRLLGDVRNFWFFVSFKLILNQTNYF